MQLSEKAKELRREYHRKWRKENRGKVRDAQRRYWQKKANELEENEKQEA